MHTIKDSLLVNLLSLLNNKFINSLNYAIQVLITRWDANIKGIVYPNLLGPVSIIY